jgi:aminoglycoside phosphotransferase (APT) family kinase protein
VGIAGERDVDALRAGLQRWARATIAPDATIGALEVPGAGLSADTYFASVAAATGGRELVVRLAAAGAGLFPVDDLAGQAAVQNEVAALGVPAVPAEWVADPQWVGEPFVAMARVAGHAVPRMWPVRGWLAGTDAPTRTRAVEGFVTTVAALHRTTAGRPDAESLRATVDRWWEYLSWAAGTRAAPGFLTEARDWCDRNRPAEPRGAVRLWGDVQLTNAVFTDAGEVAALLDWEMTSVGPPELDLGWFVALYEMTLAQHAEIPPGVPRRAELITDYEVAAGRLLVDLPWFEVFGLVRSAAIMVRIARLLAAQGVDDSWLTGGNPAEAALAAAIARADAG